MLRRLSILSLNFVAAIALTSPAIAQANPSPPTPGLNAEHLYNGVNRPVMLEVVSPRSFGTVTLQLMDFDGKPLAEPVEVHPGRIDLAEKLPAIWNLRRTAYLQMIDLSQSVGPALVLQPMLSRMTPVTQVVTHPVTGNLSTRIVGWIDENDPSVQTPALPQTPRPSPQSAPATSPAATGDTPPLPGGANAASTQPDVTPAAAEQSAADKAKKKPIERLFSGLRIYPEIDVILHTSKGDIRVCMKPDEAPNTAWNFLELSRGGFYRGIVFHRIVPLTASGLPFVIQTGDPTASGDGGPGYWLPIEDSKLPHDFGVISMARSDDPDSNGSQFFICLSREGTARLDGQYCAFGYAVDGAQTIKAIAESELADVKAGRPKDPPVIQEAELVPAPPRSVGKGRPDEKVTVEAALQPTTRPGRVPR